MKYIITLPDCVTDVPRVDYLLNSLMHLAGGFTAVPCKGAWKSPSSGVIEEPVTQYHFCMGADVGISTADEAVGTLVLGVLANTAEEAVLVEMHSPRGYSHKIYTAEDFK